MTRFDVVVIGGLVLAIVGTLAFCAVFDVDIGGTVAMPFYLIR